MSEKRLTDNPLIEAIFEFQWNLEKTSSGIMTDPHYKILIGQLYDKIKEVYPFYEQLQTATIPDEIAGYLIQHRFRKNKDEWPLIQLGPGIITLNDTERYVWEDFEKKILFILDNLFKLYPHMGSDIMIKKLLLRYINAIEFNFENMDIFNFLENKMKIKIGMNKKLFLNTGVTELPLGFDLRSSFHSKIPRGAIHLRFARGKKKNADALIWETMVESLGEDVPQTQIKIEEWVNNAHNLAEDWFFKIIEGDLFRRFE